MNVLVKKFSLRHDNVVYPTGSVVELPAEAALKLVADAPEEFAIVSEIEKAAKPQADKRSSKENVKSESASKLADDCVELPAVDEAATIQ